jgi:hypothetical protein
MHGGLTSTVLHSSAYPIVFMATAFPHQAMRVAAALLRYPCAFAGLRCEGLLAAFGSEELPVKARACEMLRTIAAEAVPDGPDTGVGLVLPTDHRPQTRLCTNIAVERLQCLDSSWD